MRRDLTALRSERFDLLVVGGGIYGAWSAYDGALRGLRVALLERADWGAETSSASSKLIHGGLRYLEQLRFRLVRKSLAERGRLARLAPHRVRPLRLVLPVRRGDRVGRIRLAAGLSIYDLLARDTWPVGSHESLDARAVSERAPALDPAGIVGGFELGDCVTDDARFALEIVAGAEAAGAAVASRVEARGLLRAGRRVAGALVADAIGGEEIEVRASVVLDATGTRAGALAAGGAPLPALPRRSKGVHLVLPALPGTRALLLVSRVDGRPIFLLPWYGRTIVGTTDEDYRGEPSALRVEEREIDYLLREANGALAPPGFARADVIASFAGLRALRPDLSRESAEVTRDWSLDEPEEALLVSVGGKYTSARADAARAVDRACEILGRDARGHPTATRPFPWCPDEPLDSWIGETARTGRAVGLDPDCATAVAWRYGASVGALHGIVRDRPALAARLDPAAPFCAAEIVHAVRNEGALRLEDAVRRRLPLVLVRGPDHPAIDTAAGVMAEELGWSAERTRAELGAARATGGPRSGAGS